MHVSPCKHCNTQFRHKRLDAKYCSARCRQKAHIERFPEAPAEWRAKHQAKIQEYALEVCPC